MSASVDAVVVGAGPAGLAAGASLVESGADVIVVELGRPAPARNEDDPTDLICGVGGAGLFSDGKFSFFPSGTALWRLEPRERLDRAYGRFLNSLSLAGRADLVDRHGLLPTPEEWERRADSPQERKRPADTVARKAYPSYYVTAEDRRAIVNDLTSVLGTALLTNTVLDIVEAAPSSVLARIRTHEGETRLIEARAVVWSGGRFGPIELERCAEFAMVPRRVELGVRLEQDEDAFFLRDEINLDPKLLLRGTMGDEVRTFCCCRGGKVLTTSFLGIASVSGRADCPPTGRSNVGLLVRVPIESQAVVWRTFVQRSSQEAILGIPLSSVRWGSDPRLTAVGIGFPLQRTIGAAIDEFRRIYPSVDEGRPLIYAPAVEGVHLYPEVNSSLRMETVPVWVAGDSTGAFRGLTAALVSGHFCALGVIEEVK